MNTRNDTRTAFVIDKALHTSSIYGVEVATLTLLERGVSREIIMRVLTSPLRRRGAGQRTYAATLG